jgi:hypothetical protein
MDRSVPAPDAETSRTTENKSITFSPEEQSNKAEKTSIIGLHPNDGGLFLRGLLPKEIKI